MFKIGEFSKLTQVSIRMLRYYDETGLLKPEQVDKFTGYRLYSSEQIPVLNRIIFLRDLGFNVAEIGIALSDWRNEGIISSLANKGLEIERSIQEGYNKLDKIQLAIKEMKQEKKQIYYDIAIKHIPSVQVLSLRRIIPDYYAEGALWKEMSCFVKENNITAISTDTFSIYHDKEHKEKDVDVELCVIANKKGESKGEFIYRDTEEVLEMACTMVYGPFENIAGSFYSLASWIEKHSRYKMTGESRQIVHRGPWNEENPEKYLTEIQVALERI